MTAIIATGCYDQSPPPPALSAQLSNKSVGYSHRFLATATYTIASDGKVKNQTPTILETWLLSGVNSNFEVMATVSGGETPDAGDLGTWLACTSDRSWSISATDNEDRTTVLIVQIRNASSHTVLASATITITASSWT